MLALTKLNEGLLLTEELPGVSSVHHRGKQSGSGSAHSEFSRSWVRLAAIGSGCLQGRAVLPDRAPSNLLCPLGVLRRLLFADPSS